MAVDEPPLGSLRVHALSVEHQRDVVDRLKHEPTDKSAKPPIDRLPRRKIIRQHPPPPARTGHVADCVQHLPQIDLDRSPSRRCRGRKGSIRTHSSSVKSLGYRLVFFSILAIRPRVAGVHIPSLNHGRKPHSTTFQTDSKALEAGCDAAGGGLGHRFAPSCQGGTIPRCATWRSVQTEQAKTAGGAKIKSGRSDWREKAAIWPALASATGRSMISTNRSPSVPV